MVPNTSELLPDPDTPVNTVSRRFGISMLTSLRLFTRAPCTRIRSWLSATCSAGDCVSVLVAMLIVSPSVRQGRLRGLHRRRLARYDQLRAVRLVLLRFGPWGLWAAGTRRARPRRQANQRPSACSHYRDAAQAESAAKTAKPASSIRLRPAQSARLPAATRRTRYPSFGAEWSPAWRADSMFMMCAPLRVFRTAKPPRAAVPLVDVDGTKTSSAPRVGQDVVCRRVALSTQRRQAQGVLTSRILRDVAANRLTGGQAASPGSAGTRGLHLGRRPLSRRNPPVTARNCRVRESPKSSVACMVLTRPIGGKCPSAGDKVCRPRWGRRQRMSASAPAASTTWVIPEMVSGPHCPSQAGPGWRPR